MADQSHREEMSAAIRAQRQRNAVPRSMTPERPAEPPAAPPEPEKPKRLLDRFRAK